MTIDPIKRSEKLFDALCKVAGVTRKDEVLEMMIVLNALPRNENIDISLQSLVTLIEEWPVE